MFRFHKSGQMGGQKTTWKKPCKFAISAWPTFAPVKHQQSRTERCLSRDQSLITCSLLVQWTNDFMVCSSQSIIISSFFVSKISALPSFQSTDKVPCSRMKLLLTFNNVTLCPLSHIKKILKSLWSPDLHISETVFLSTNAFGKIQNYQRSQEYLTVSKAARYWLYLFACSLVTSSPTLVRSRQEKSEAVLRAFSITKLLDMSL